MKYRLKKDLPFFKAGKLYETYDSRSPKYIELLSDGEIFSYPRDTFSDWFEEVDERWKPGERDKYWNISSGFLPRLITCCIDSADEKWYSAGNCFRTRELAEKAAEEIKTLLKGFHKNNP